MQRVGEASLFQVVEAGGLFGLVLRSSQRGQQHRGENGNDGDDDKQLDERESLPPEYAGVGVCIRGDFLIRSCGKGLGDNYSSPAKNNCHCALGAA